MDNPTCNSGHSDYPPRLWDCPVCVAKKIALLEDVVEILSDAPGAPIFVDNEVFSLDEIRSWVQRYVAWTMRRIDALAKLEKQL